MAAGGAWSAQEPQQCGQRLLRFFVDFPQDARRNDVTLPAGRLFFSSACWDATEMASAEQRRSHVEAELERLRNEQQAASGAGRNDLNLLQKADELRRSVDRVAECDELTYELGLLRKGLPGSRGSLDGPPGVRVAAAGGLSIKANGPKNLYGGVQMPPIAASAASGLATRVAARMPACVSYSLAPAAAPAAPSPVATPVLPHPHAHPTR